MTYNVFGGTLNPTHSLTHYVSPVVEIAAVMWLFCTESSHVANDRQTLHTFLTARQKGAIVLSPAASPNADRLSKTISPTASAVNVQFTAPT